MESSNGNASAPSIAKKILHIFKVVYYMIRKGIISKRKLMVDLHLLLKRGKIAGKAIGKLMTSHHPTDSLHSSFSCMSVDPTHSFYNPTREVEFSCSNTPAYAYTSCSHKRKNRKNSSYDYEAVAAIAKAFELLNNNNNTTDIFSDAESMAPSVAPSPMINILGFGKSPRMVRQLRITDSPFPIMEDEVSCDHGKVDKEAQEFINRFYEQLRSQQSLATPEPYNLRRRG